MTSEGAYQHARASVGTAVQSRRGIAQARETRLWVRRRRVKSLRPLSLQRAWIADSFRAMGGMRSAAETGNSDLGI